MPPGPVCVIAAPVLTLGAKTVYSCPMIITAKVQNSLHSHQVSVQTNDAAQALSIPAKSTGPSPCPLLLPTGKRTRGTRVLINAAARSLRVR